MLYISVYFFHLKSIKNVVMATKYVGDRCQAKKTSQTSLLHPTLFHSRLFPIRDCQIRRRESSWTLRKKVLCEPFNVPIHSRDRR